MIIMYSVCVTCGENMETQLDRGDTDHTASQNARSKKQPNTWQVDNEYLDTSANKECQETIKSEETKVQFNADTTKSESSATQVTLNVHCEVCNHTYKYKKQYDKHLISNSCKRVREFYGKIFYRRQIGKDNMHIKSHNKQKDHRCATCGKCYYGRNYLLRHQRVIYGGEKPFVCELCGAVYRNDPKFSDRYAWANSADPDQE